MIVKVNGKEQTFENDKLSVSEILKVSKAERPEVVSVQLNGEFVKKENYESTYVKEADEIDFLYFMGGGSV